MKWAEVSIHTSQEAIDAITNILHEAGAGGVIIEDPEVLERDWKKLYDDVYELSPEDFPEEGVYIKSYFPVNSYLLENVDEIKQLVASLKDYGIDIGKGDIHISEVNEEDWAHNWKKYYKPVKVSEKFLISPAWEKVDNETKNQLVIQLDPGMAFGTGTHPTTVLCLRALEGIVDGNENVVDVGCGTGVLSIAAAKLGVKEVLALDIDHVAVESAIRNTKLNLVDSKIEIRQNNLLNGIEKEADIVVANILTEVILKVTSDVARILKPNGYFITSGIIQSKAEQVKNDLVEKGFQIVDTLLEEDWVAFVAKRI